MVSNFLTPLALAASFLSATTTAAPLQPRAQTSTTLTAKSILSIDPSTSSCANSPAPNECRTAAQAAPYLALSFTNFHAQDFNTQAALLSLILFETAGFKYSRNHFPAPGRPGQGTRNMQMPENNLKYAQWLAQTCTNCGISAEAVAKAEKAGPDAVLDLVNGDQWGFSSAAWFLDTQCEGSVKEGLASGSLQGWESYLTGCVGTTATEERTAIWRKAVGLGHW